MIASHGNIQSDRYLLENFRSKKRTHTFEIGSRAICARWGNCCRFANFDNHLWSRPLCVPFWNNMQQRKKNSDTMKMKLNELCHLIDSYWKKRNKVSSLLVVYVQCCSLINCFFIVFFHVRMLVWKRISINTFFSFRAFCALCRGRCHNV